MTTAVDKWPAYSRLLAGLGGRSGRPLTHSSYTTNWDTTTVPFFSDLWLAGKRQSLPPASLGDAFLFDLYQPAKPLTHFGFPLPATCDSIAAAIRGRRAWAER